MPAVREKGKTRSRFFESILIFVDRANFGVDFAENPA